MRFARHLATLTLAAAVASPAAAINLLTNPSFAGNQAGWNAGTAYDGGIDATGVPGSGSARSDFNAPGASTLLAIDQCVATGPGNYTLGGKVYMPNGQPVAGSGMVTVSFFNGGSCLGGLLGFSNLTTAVTGSFQTLSGPIVAPPGTTNIWVTGQNGAAGAGMHTVYFDDFVLDNGVAPTAVPALGPLGVLLLAALSGVMGYTTLRRRG